MPCGLSLPDKVGEAVEAAVAERDNDGGDLLVFLPGAEEIRRTQRRLESTAARDDLLVLPLHGSLPYEEQARALRPPADGRSYSPPTSPRRR